MLRRLAPAILLLLLACNDDPPCVIDTDCAGTDICVNEECVPRGGLPDADVPDAEVGDGGEGDAGGGDMGVEPGSVGTGSVVLLSIPPGADPTDTGRFTVSAGFSLANPDCTRSIVGGCDVLDCPAPPPVDMDAGVPEPDPLPNAGTIQTSGGSIAVALEPDAMTGAYASETGTMPLFDPAAELAVRAPGAEVPMFRADLQGVAPVLVSSPVVPDTGTLTVDPDAGLNLEWPPPGAGPEDAEMRALVTANAGGARWSATCYFPVTDGTGNIPPEVWAGVPEGRTNRLQLLHVDRETIDQSGWRVEVETRARVSITDSAGANRNFSVPFASPDPAAP